MDQRDLDYITTNIDCAVHKLKTLKHDSNSLATIDLLDEVIAHCAHILNVLNLPPREDTPPPTPRSKYFH